MKDFLNSFLTKMKNKYYLSVLLIVAITPLIFFTTRTFAENDDITDLENQIAYLQDRIDVLSEEYDHLSEEAQTYREYCDLLSSAETELAKLNGVNVARRRRIRSLERQIERKKGAAVKSD